MGKNLTSKGFYSRRLFLQWHSDKTRLAMLKAAAKKDPLGVIKYLDQVVGDLPQEGPDSSNPFGLPKNLDIDALRAIRDEYESRLTKPE